ncbi:hypothetical protein GCM10008995_03430 [Halobellus salinus]|uniref:PQQ-like domain-containing protein n=1 Tax=Halobellus salinus TaxID=931585 RepID=A0A830EM05_9EURY|nr:hypothetical protein [Halobellus salinus]GGI96728.1 hypothetical protein GCM10008995_03430 [Halobellus salinus]SMP13415.1 hypothetical protein SAMN06265347_104192 [Halobellus salinus]
MTGRASEGGTADDTPDAVAGGDLPREYAQVRSVDTGAIALIAAGDSRIALASVSGGVSVLAAGSDDGARFGVEARPRGLAVGPLVYVAVDDHVFGYGFDGARRWEAPIDGATALCWVPDQSRVVAATDTGEFVLLDDADGTERGRIDRTHADVSETVLLAGRGEEFLAGESWYLTGFGPDGDRTGEAMLDGTITGVGLLEDVAVVSLHGDRVVGVDADDGAIRWELHLDVEWLAPRGDGGLYAAADHGVVRISADGAVTDVGIDTPDATQVAVTTDGEVACRIDGRTAGVLRPAASLSGVDLDLSPTSLRVGSELVVTAETIGEPTTGTVRASADDGSFRPESRRVSLDAGERTELRFTLAEAAGSRLAARATFTPGGTDGSEPTEVGATISVPPATPTPVVGADVTGVDDGTATVEVSVRTPDGSDLPAVSLSPGGVDIDPEPGRSSVSRTLSLPLTTERVTATTGDGESVDAAVSPPTTPLSASVSARDDGFVDVTLRNDTDITVHDDVRVTGDPLVTPVERSVSLPAGGRLTLALPSARAGVGEVRIDAAAVDATAAVSLDRATLPSAGGTDAPQDGRNDHAHDGKDRVPGADTPTRGGRDTPSTPHPDRDTTPPDSAEAGDASAPATPPDRDTTPPDSAEAGDASAPATPPDRDTTPPDSAEPGDASAPAAPPDRDTTPPDSAEAGDASAPAAPGSAGQPDATPGPERGPSPESVDSPVSPAAPDDSAASEESASPAPRDPLGLDRSLDSDTAHEGHALEETLTVENRSPEPKSITLRSDGDAATVELSPETTATATRYHAAWDTSSIEVPPVTASADDAEVTVPGVSVPVEPAPVVVRPALSAGSTTTDVRLDVHNNLETSCSVLEIGSKGFSTGVGFDGFDVAPGGDVTREITYQGAPTERPALTLVRIDHRQRPLQTLAAVHDSHAPPVSVAVDSVDILGDRDTNVVLRLENEGGAPVAVRVEATGTAPDEYLYAPGEIDALDPGSTATHRVECTVNDDRVELPIELEVTPFNGADGPHSTAVTVSGDRTDNAERWRVDAEDEADTPTLPDTLSTRLDVRSSE